MRVCVYRPCNAVVMAAVWVSAYFKGNKTRHP